MSKLKHVAWWIEWSPEFVRAVNVGGTVHQANSLAELGGAVSGPAVILLGRRGAFVKSARVPNAKASEIGAVVRMQAAQIFPNMTGELAYGFKLTDNVDGNGRLAILAATPVSTLEEIHRQAKGTGIKIIGALPVAFGSMLLARHQAAPICAVVEQTHEGVSIDVVEDGNLVYSRIANIDADVKSEVERTFTAAGRGSGPILSKMAVVQEPNQVLGDNAASALIHSGTEFEEALIELPSAVAIREKQAVTNRSRLAMLMAVAAIGVAALIFDGRSQEQEVAQRQKAEFTKGIRTWTKKRDAASAESGKLNALVSEVDRAFKPPQSPSDAVMIVGNSIPKGVWLTGINFERGKPLMLRGVAMNNESVGLFLDTLTNSDRYRDVKLVFANQALIESTSVVQFSMSAHVVGNLPAMKTKKERGKK